MALKPVLVTDGQLAEALRLAFGNRSAAARIVGLQPSEVYRRINVTPYLRKVLTEAIEYRLDAAEANLDRFLGVADWKATQFVLSTLGKGRGYIPRTENDNTQRVHLTHEEALKELDEDDAPE